MKLPLWMCSTHVSAWSQSKAESLDCGRVFAACIEDGMRPVCWCEADVLATVVSRSRMSECQPSMVEYQTAWNFRIKIIYFLCWDKPTGEGSCMCSVLVPWLENIQMGWIMTLGRQASNNRPLSPPFHPIPFPLPFPSLFQEGDYKSRMTTIWGEHLLNVLRSLHLWAAL